MDKTKIAVSVFDKLATEYQNRFMNVDLYGDTFDFFCKHIPENGEVLELACGPGNITKYILDKRPDLKILGTDLAPNMLKLAEINNPTAKFRLMDCREIGKLEKKYHAVMCGFCLPYLDKVETALLFKASAAVLNPGGLLYISTMEDEYEKSGFRKGSTGDEIYMHYYPEKFLVAALEQNKFEIILTERKISEMTDGSKVTDLIIIAKK